MAGDEPSEDAEAGADADGKAGAGEDDEVRDDGEGVGDADSTSDEPADGPGEGSQATDEAEADAADGDRESDDSQEAGPDAESHADADPDDSEEPEPDETASGASDAEGEPDDESSDGSGAGAIPMAPDSEADPEVDPPAPSVAEDVDPDEEFQAPNEADFAEPPESDVAEPDGHATPVVDDTDADEAEAEAPGGVFGGPGSGPAEDREMPLADHIREMLQRLAVVVAIAGLVSLLVFPFAEDVINFLWYSILPGVESDIARPRLYGVLELVFTELKVASLAGLIVALPVMVYETYAFMRPGLYPHERRYYLAAIPTSLVLALVGVSFAYFVVLPAIFTYFLYYSQDVATIGFALGRTFDLILLMMGYLAVVFQIPLFLMLAMMMGLVTRQWLAERRLLFWGAFLGLSFFFGFDPTGMAPIIVAATMIFLFEGTLLLTKWTGRE